MYMYDRRECATAPDVRKWVLQRRIPHAIQSGVAQACPLSPLLFLVVAEALRVSVDLEMGLEGVNIGYVLFSILWFMDRFTTTPRYDTRTDA